MPNVISGGDNNNKNNNGGFANDKQRKFYLIKKAIKIGNITATAVLIVFIGKYLFGGG